MKGMTQEQDFDIFLDFITHFCMELSSGISPEYALNRTTRYFGNQSPPFMREAVNDIKCGTKPFMIAWTDIVNGYQERGYYRILELLGRFMEKGSKVGGTRMLIVLKHVRKNMALGKNRRNLVNAQKIKIIALSLVASAVLGMIGGIAPLFSMLFVENLFVSYFFEIHNVVLFQIFTALFFTVIVTGYRLNQTVGNSIRTTLLCVVAYLMTFSLTLNLLYLFF